MNISAAVYNNVVFVRHDDRDIAGVTCDYWACWLIPPTNNRTRHAAGYHAVLSRFSPDAIAVICVIISRQRRLEHLFDTMNNISPNVDAITTTDRHVGIIVVWHVLTYMVAMRRSSHSLLTT